MATSKAKKAAAAAAAAGAALAPAGNTAPASAGEALPIAEQAATEVNATAAAGGADAPAGGAPRETVQDPPTAADAAGGDLQPSAEGDPAPVPAPIPSTTIEQASALAGVSTARDAFTGSLRDLLAVVIATPTRLGRLAIRAQFEALFHDEGDAAAVHDALRHELNAALFDLPEGDDLVEISAKSRDGHAYRRGGFVWTAEFQTVLVTPEVAERLTSDPHLVVAQAGVS